MLCHECVSGYARSGAAGCTKCTAPWRSWLALIAVVAVALAVLVFGFRRHIAGFFLGIPYASDANLFAFVAFRPQRLAQPPLVGGDQA